MEAQEGHRQRGSVGQSVSKHPGDKFTRAKPETNRDLHGHPIETRCSYLQDRMISQPEQFNRNQDEQDGRR